MIRGMVSVAVSLFATYRTELWALEVGKLFRHCIKEVKNGCTVITTLTKACENVETVESVMSLTLSLMALFLRQTGISLFCSVQHENENGVS